MTRRLIRSKKTVLPALFLFIGTLAVTGCAINDNLYKDMEQPPTPSVTKTPAAPGSIWPGATGGNMLFTDRKARYVNDVVTIVISETAEGENNAKLETNRTSVTTAGIAGVYQFNPDKTMLSKYELGGSSTNDMEGEGKNRRDGILKGRITARVTQVFDNGNLMIEGRRLITVNAEDQFMILTGVIRPEDITTDNLILSQYIADARIVYTGRGVVDDKMRPGWLTRIIDHVWPF
ncbi:MAG: flagellar basal body L-ring protein FlgH [Deltaproteobacteria bacterium]|nr:flagellar basal body L-ring protein FlgH [Deltaproteobacteria bacterium]